MANTIGSLFIAFKAQDSGLLKGLRDVQKETKETQKHFAPLQKALNQTGQAMKNAGVALTAGITLPLVALGGIATKAAMEFESSFAGVRKTVDATESEFAALSQGFRDMAKEIPISVVELNKVGESAGQLGIKKADILAFTKTMAMLGETTNLTADQAAVATAQIQNIFGTAGKDVDRFGSTLVALGNAGASTEQDIINMGLRIAGSGHAVGLSQAQVLAYASSLSSIGINAEAGGSAISRVFLKINDAVAKGGGGMNEFARIAGMTGADFKKSFETDAAGATNAFIKGLGRIKHEGENVNAAIEGVVGKNIILKDTLLRAAGAGELLTEQLELADTEWKKNTALVNEAAERHKTFESQLKLLKAQVNDAAISLGNALIPTLKKLIEFVKPTVAFLGELADKFSHMPLPLQAVVIGITAFAAAIGPVIGVIGLFLSALGSMVPLFTVVLPYLTGAAGLPAAIAVIGTALSGLLVPIAVAVAAIATLGVAAYAIYQNWETVSGLLTPIWDQIKMAATKIWDAIQTGIADFMKATSALWVTYGGDVNRIWEGIKTVIGAAWNVISDIVTAAIRIVTAVISNGFEIVLGVVEVGLGLLSGNWSLVWEGLSTIASGAFDLVKEVVIALFRFTMSEAARLIDTVAAAATAAGSALPSVLGAPLLAIGRTLDSTADGLRGFVTALDEQEKQAYEAGEAAKWFEAQTNSLTEAQRDLTAQETEKWFSRLVPAVDSSKQSAALFRLETIGVHAAVKGVTGALGDQEDALKSAAKEMDAAKKKAKEFADEQIRVRLTLNAPTFTPEYVRNEIEGSWEINKARTEASQKLQEEFGKERMRILEMDYAAQDALTKAINKAVEFNVPFTKMRESVDWINANPIVVPDKTKEDMNKLRTDAEGLQAAQDSIRNSAGHIFDEMFAKGESVFNNLKNMLKGGVLSLGRSIFQDVTAELGGRIKKAFDDFFKDLLKSTGLKSFIDGLTSKIGGIFSKLLSHIPGLSSIFGGAGAGVAAGAGGAGAAGAGAGAGGAGFGSVGALLTNPWTIAIGGAILGAVALVQSQAHHEANRYVQNFQNPFDQSIRDIHDAFYAAYSSGNLTAEAAKEARRQVAALWKTYRENAAKFAAGGKDEAKVVDQAFKEMAKYWGTDLSNIFGGFDDVINLLTEQETEAANAAENAGDAADDAGDSMDNFGDDIDDLALSAEYALNPIRRLSDAIMELGSAAAGAGAGGGSASPPSTAPRAPAPPTGTTALPEPDEIGGARPGEFASGGRGPNSGNSFWPSMTDIIRWEKEGWPSFDPKFLGSRANGLPYVPMDGFAYVHKGEAIVTAENNKKNDGQLAQILQAILIETRKGHIINLDGKRVIAVLNDTVRNGSAQLWASNLKGK